MGSWETQVFDSALLKLLRATQQLGTRPSDLPSLLHRGQTQDVVGWHSYLPPGSLPVFSHECLPLTKLLQV